MWLPGPEVFMRCKPAVAPTEIHGVTRMRVLCTTLPGVSHFFPMVPVLRSLARRGHEVKVATAASFAPRVSAFGLTPVPAGLDFEVGQEPALVPALARARARGDTRFRYTEEVLVRRLAMAALPDVARVAGRWRPDVIVRDPVEFAGAAVAEAAGIPHVTGRENRFLSERAWAAELGEGAALLGRVAGSSTFSASILYRFLGIAAGPRRYIAAATAAPPAREFGTHVPETMRFIRPEPAEPGGDQPGWWPGGSPVLVTFGTVFARQPALLRAVLAAAARMDRTFVFTVDADLFAGSPPDNVIPAGYQPLARVLPLCTAVVTVGGLGTVLASLSHGLPVVVLPINADQPLNALRCEALGVGVALAPTTARPSAIAAAIRKVVSDQALRSRATAFRSEIDALPGAGAAADLVEAVARTRMPVTALGQGQLHDAAERR